MTRSKIAAFLALAFVVLFCFAGVTATTTVKDVTVSAEMGMPKLLFSLSSAPLLLIPLAIVAAVAAFIAFIQNEKNVGMLFSFVAAVSFALFMVFFSMEEKNSALYTPISEALNLAEVKFKKRDVKLISTSFDIMTYIALACIALSCVIGRLLCQGPAPHPQARSAALCVHWTAPVLLYRLLHDPGHLRHLRRVHEVGSVQ